jgi:hypothetical protein
MAQEQMSPELPLVTVDELIAERKEFTPAAAQKDTSDQIAGILNRARYAKFAAAVDTSIFATAPQTLFGMDSKSSAESIAPATDQFRSPPPEIEEI